MIRQYIISHLFALASAEVYKPQVKSRSQIGRSPSKFTFHPFRTPPTASSMLRGDRGDMMDGAELVEPGFPSARQSARLAEERDRVGPRCHARPAGRPRREVDRSGRRGLTEVQTCRIEPAPNPFGAKVLPMSPVRSVTHVSGPDNERSGSPGRIRTIDQPVNSRLLYR